MSAIDAPWYPPEAVDLVSRLMAEATAAKPLTWDALLDALAPYVTAVVEKAETLLTVEELTVRAGKIDLKAGGPGASAFAVVIGEFFLQQGGENYVEITLRDPRDAQVYAPTCQRVKGLTPHQLRQAAEERADKAEKELAGFEPVDLEAWVNEGIRRRILGITLEKMNSVIEESDKVFAGGLDSMTDEGVQYFVRTLFDLPEVPA